MRFPSNIYLLHEDASHRFAHRFGLGDERGADDNAEWTQLYSGRHHRAALTKKGELYTWGRNSYGQLGHGDQVLRRVPTKVVSLNGFVIIKVVCGAFHMAALTDKGELLTWGRGWEYQQGNDFGENKLTPKKVEAIAGEVIVEVTCGYYHTCAITSTGSIYTWGGDIATGHHGGSPVPLPGLLRDLSTKYVICVSSHLSITACVTKDGEVYTWGTGTGGNLGHGDRRNQYSTPKRVEEALIGVKAKQVACGLNHTAVCTEDGEVFTFGSGCYGQLGHGDKENKTSPVLVKALQGKHTTQVQCTRSGHHTTALTSSGYVFTWGDGENGRLGSKSSELGLSIPCLVEGLRDHNVVQISSDYQYCAALVDPGPSFIRQSQQTACNNKENSDVVFMVENEPVYANVDVISQKCEYFKAMFRSNMRESIERVVQVPNCSKGAFLGVLEYLCLDGFVVSLDHVLELWYLADMYQLEGLKLCCMGALESGDLLCKENVSQILKEAENLSCPCNGLKRMCHEYLERSK